MKTENDFNAYLTKEIRKLGTDYRAVKLCDRFKIGLADWLMFYKGKPVALEAKFVKTLPKTKAKKVLGHPITGPQISFLVGMELAGVRGFAIVASSSDSMMRLIPTHEIPPTGNFTLEEFLKLTETRSCKISDINILMEMLFNEGTGNPLDKQIPAG